MKTLICIPGLGGHPSVFNEYKALLPEYNLRMIELVDPSKALADTRAAVREEKEPVVLFCHCYAEQLGIQVAAEMPDKVSHLIILEPVFSEFLPWTKALWPLCALLLAGARLTDRMGLRRRHFTYEPDYVELAKYPLFVQPLFDMRWQNLTDYFRKCWEQLTYRLPPRVEAPTLMILAPGGFSSDARTKERLKKIFVNARLVDMEQGTHNIVTMGGVPVAVAVRGYLGSATA